MLGQKKGGDFYVLRGRKVYLIFKPTNFKRNPKRNPDEIWLTKKGLAF
jgi:hypothetical protein